MSPANSYLIDTNILINAIRQKKDRWELLHKLVLLQVRSATPHQGQNSERA